MTREFDFYIVPTPIGNIQDITLRAIEVLKNVDIVACEDTRITQKLLNHYDIKTKCISYHKYNERERVGMFLNILKEGKKIALVSDAGTPLICDPGAVIVPELIKNNFSVTSLPGACAVTTFLSQIPRYDESFTFIGFIPRSEKQIKDIVNVYATQNLVFYDSPERILKTLKIISDCRRNPCVALGRELSKLYEEVLVDSADNVIEYFKGGIKGEIICMIYAEYSTDINLLMNKACLLQEKGFTDKDISVILSTIFKCNKNEIYKALINKK